MECSDGLLKHCSNSNQESGIRFTLQLALHYTALRKQALKTLDQSVDRKFNFPDRRAQASIVFQGMSKIHREKKTIHCLILAHFNGCIIFADVNAKHIAS